MATCVLDFTASDHENKYCLIETVVIRMARRVKDKLCRKERDYHLPEMKLQENRLKAAGFGNLLGW